MPDPTTQAFWDDERKRFWEVFGPLAMDVLLAGAQQGAAQLPTEIQPLIDWGDFNANAIKYLKQYELRLYDELTLATRQQVMTIIEDWLASGQHMDALRMQLGLLLGQNKADTLAITEITRIFAQGNLGVWQATHFIGAKQWQTAVDSRVCPLCGPLHGQIIAIDSNFTQSAFQLAGSDQMLNLTGSDQQQALKRALSLVKSSGESVNGPPRHFRCRCWLLPVVDVESFRRSLFNVTGPVEQFEMMAKEHLSKLSLKGAVLING